MFLNCSTRFERHTAHHQELRKCNCRCRGNHDSYRQPQTYVKSETVITVFELLMMSGVSLETCWAIKKHWNNKFYYAVNLVGYFYTIWKSTAGGKETNLRELLNLNMKQVYGARPRVLTIILLRPAGLSSASKFFRGSASLSSSAAEDCRILRVSGPARHCAAWHLPLLLHH
jgi:hypothetical protein